MGWLCDGALRDDGATLDDLREAAETLRSVAPLWTRVFRLSHPIRPMFKALEDALVAGSGASGFVVGREVMGETTAFWETAGGTGTSVPEWWTCTK